MIDIVKNALDYAVKQNISCEIQFDNGIFTTADRYTVPDICELSHYKEPGKYTICRRVYNHRLPFQFIGILDVEAFNYDREMELTKDSIRIGVVFMKFAKPIWR